VQPDSPSRMLPASPERTALGALQLSSPERASPDKRAAAQPAVVDHMRGAGSENMPEPMLSGKPLPWSRAGQGKQLPLEEMLRRVRSAGIDR
jgi:hypothetical protein